MLTFLFFSYFGIVQKNDSLGKIQFYHAFCFGRNFENIPILFQYVQYGGFHFDAVPVRIYIFSSSLSQRQGNLITEGNSGKWEHGIWTSPSQLTLTLQTTATLCPGAVDTTVLYIRVCLQCRCLAWRWQSFGNFTLGLALSFTMLKNMCHGHSKLTSRAASDS